MRRATASGAGAIYQPLIDKIIKDHPKSLDPTTLRIFLGGVRAYMASNDMEKARNVGILLMDLGPDTDVVNSALVGFAKMVDKERKKANAEDIRAVSPEEKQAAKTRLKAMENVQGQLLQKLAGRDAVSAAGMVWIAETCSDIGLDDAAVKQCQRFLDRAEKDKKGPFFQAPPASALS